MLTEGESGTADKKASAPSAEVSPHSYLSRNPTVEDSSEARESVRQTQEPAPTSAKSLIDALLPVPVSAVLKSNGAELHTAAASATTTGPGSCTLFYKQNNFWSGNDGITAVMEFRVPGIGVAHSQAIKLADAAKRDLFGRACWKAIDNSGVSGIKQDELREWVEKRLCDVKTQLEAIEKSRALAKQPKIPTSKEQNQALSLLRDPALLFLLGRTLETEAGLVGETQNALLIYLALTSRLQEKIISCIVKSESSAGKSFLVESVLKLFPKEAYLSLSGMSPQALLYSQENVKNRFIVIAEAAGVSEKAEYNLRTLISENRLEFSTVEKNLATGRNEPRTLSKEGPTGLLLTTTAAGVNAENETRLLSLSLDESEEQSRRIMKARARQWSSSRGKPDLCKWINAQSLLRGVQVEIPYADFLMEKLPPKPLRIRRDSDKLLACIAASALLHQEQRPCSGNVVRAGLEDYYIVKELLETVFFRSLNNLPKKTLEVMEAIKKIYKEKNHRARVSAGEEIPLEQFVTTKELTAELGWTKTTTLKWAKRLTDFEWIASGEGEDQQGFEFRPGYEPKNVKLPSVEELAEQFPELSENFKVVDPITGKTETLEKDPPQEKRVARITGRGHYLHFLRLV
jgi:hypothetical protein